MPDLTKKHMRAVLDLNIVSLARIHKYYLAGFAWAIETEEEVRKANEFIASIEKLLIGTGYMTETEVKARHTMFLNQDTQPDLKSLREPGT